MISKITFFIDKKFCGRVSSYILLNPKINLRVHQVSWSIWTEKIQIIKKKYKKDSFVLENLKTILVRSVILWVEQVWFALYCTFALDKMCIQNRKLQFKKNNNNYSKDTFKMRFFKQTLTSSFELFSNLTTKMWHSSIPRNKCETDEG